MKLYIALVFLADFEKTNKQTNVLLFIYSNEALSILIKEDRLMCNVHHIHFCLVSGMYVVIAAS